MILKYGLQETEIKFIDDVQNGLDCNCKCISCGEELIARNGGEVNEHHFAHRSGNTCEDLNLVLVTYMFKEALEETKELKLPKVYIKIESCETKLLVNDERVIQVNKIIDFNKNSITVLTSEFTELIIVVNLKKSKLKIDFDLEEKDLIEVLIDVSKIESKEDIIKLLKSDTLKIKWLNNKYEEYQKKKLELLVERKRFVSEDKVSIVKDCPIQIRSYNQESFARLEEDCLSCKYYLCGDRYSDIINCLGKTKILSIKDLERIESVERIKNEIMITYLDGREERIALDQTPATNLINLWIENNKRAFLARNIETNIAVFIKKDPQKQHEKYNKCYGQMYKNGYSIGDREIYGYLLDQWLIIPNKKRKETIKTLRKY
jgi:hypothetical protein